MGANFYLNRNNPDLSRTRPDLAIAALAQSQHGLVTADQLREIGLDADAISYRAGIGRLRLVFPRAYAVGHAPLTREGWFQAAVLSLGADAAISGVSSAQLRGLFKHRIGEIHITTTRRPKPRDGIRIHSVKTMPPTTRVQGIPATAPAHAVLECAGQLYSDKALTRVAREAQVQGLVTHDELLQLCADSAGARGVVRLRGILAGGAARTRSGLEDRVLALIRMAGLPEPEMNVVLFGCEVDFFFPQFNLVIEVDGGVHENPLARADDARKQAILEAHGVRVLRVSEAQADDEALTVRRLLAAVA